MPSLSEVLVGVADRCGDRTAVVFGDRTYSYRELNAVVELVASHLAASGVKQGDRVLLIGGNSDYFVIGAYAALRAGAILVPANPRSAPPELAYLIDDSGATVVLATPDLASLAEEGARQSSTRPGLFALGGGSSLTDVIARATSNPLAAVDRMPVESDDALLIYTSGTTGNPKGALFDHHRAAWVGINVAGVGGLGDGERFLHVAPLYHAAELCMLLFPGTMFAGTHYILPAFDPALVARTLSEEKITVFFGVPTMYQFLLMVPGLDELDLTNWRVGFFGAAPMPASVVVKLLEALPTVLLYQLCGQTEAGPGGIFSGPEDVRLRPDASGRYPIPNTTCRVVDEGGNQVAPGHVGELILQGETVMKGYWNRPEETAATIRNGWLHTGDLALLDEDGYMTLVDRLKDMIITGGRNVYSVEVENALVAHPDLTDVAVLGIPHDTYGESILAVVTAREGAVPTIEEVREWSKGRITDYKIPHRLVIHTIPRNPSGKIQKHVLREQLKTESLLSV